MGRNGRAGASSARRGGARCRNRGAEGAKGAEEALGAKGAKEVNGAKGAKQKLRRRRWKRRCGMKIRYYVCVYIHILCMRV